MFGISFKVKGALDCFVKAKANKTDSKKLKFNKFKIKSAIMLFLAYLSWLLNTKILIAKTSFAIAVHKTVTPKT